MFVWKNGTAAHINNFELVSTGGPDERVGLRGRQHHAAGRLEELAMHPTVKPVALVADAIKDCSRPAAWCSIRSAAAAPS